MNDIGKNLKALREYFGMTIKDLSDKSHIGQSTISELETGKAKNPKSETLSKLAIAFNIPLDLFFQKDPVRMIGKPVTDIKIKKWDKEYPNLKQELEVYDSINKDKSNITNIPIVGVVRAGKPILAVENIEGYLPVLNEFLDSDKNYFYLRVKGDSMNQEFQEGSLLLVEKTSIIENGKIGVVLIDSMEATVKKIVKNNNMITLIPMSSNPIYVPQMYDIKKDQIQIIGVVKQATKVY